MNDASKLVVEPLTDRQREAACSLYGEMFGSAKAERFRQRFDWWYRENPFLEANQVSNWVMTRDAEVVGHLGLVPVPIKIGDESFRGTWLCDYMVREGSRFGKPFLRLTTSGWGSSEFSMGYGLPAHVARIYAKLGWKRGNVAPALIKPLGLQGALRLLTAGSRGARSAAPVLGTVASFLRIARGDRGARRGADGGNEALALSADFDDSFDALWSEVRDGYAIAVERTQAYLRWRYASRNGTAARVIKLRGRRGLGGFAVVEKVQRRGIVVGLISELVVRREDTVGAATLLAFAEDLLRREAVSAMVSEGFPSAIRDVFRERGFLQEGGEAPRMVFFDRHNRCNESFLGNPDSWLLTFGDSDRSLGYPRVP